MASWPKEPIFKEFSASGDVAMELQSITKFVPYFKCSDSTVCLVDAEETFTTDSLAPVSVKTTTIPLNKVVPALTTEDTTGALIVQIVVALVVAGIGTLGTGLLLNKVQLWPIYRNVSEMFIMVPPLLGLKGNLEMTLASRLSTLEHLGALNSRNDQLYNFGGNLALTQTQAITFAALASLVAVVFRSMRTRHMRFGNFALLCASGMVAASSAAFILGLLMISVIFVARRCRLNPDNIATPLAASFANEFPPYRTLGIFSAIGLGLETQSLSLPGGIISLYAIIAPIFAFIAWHIPSSKSVLIHGWTPVLIALIIACFGGFILETAVSRFSSIALYQPVINGMGGNLAAVLASRLSTDFHKFGDTLLPKSRCFNPLASYWGSSGNARCARILLFVVLPGQTLFMLIIHYASGRFGDERRLTALFVVAYLGSALLQVFLLLNITFLLVPTLWRFRFNPDNWAIPLLTALGDLLGTGLLAAAFYLLALVEKR